MDERQTSADRFARALGGEFRLDHVSDAQAGVIHAVEKNPDCGLVASGQSQFDPLRICSQLRSIDRTRFMPILLISDPGEDERIMLGT